MVMPSYQNAANAPAAQPVQQGSNGANGPEYVTRAELEGFESRLKELLSGNYQAVQSQTDRYQDRVQKALAEFKSGLEAMRAGGVVVSQEQIDQAQNKVILDALAKGDEPAQQAVQPGAQIGQPQGLIETVTAAAEMLMDVSGVSIEDDDPEVELIEAKATATPQEYLDAVKTAISAKRDRLAKGPPLARMPALSGGGQPASNDIQNIMDPAQLWEIAKRDGKVR